MLHCVLSTRCMIRRPSHESFACRDLPIGFGALSPLRLPAQGLAYFATTSGAARRPAETSSGRYGRWPVLSVLCDTFSETTPSQAAPSTLRITCDARAR